MAEPDLDVFFEELSAWAAERDPGAETHRYGPEPDHEADVRLPAGIELRGTAFVLHGGFWRERWRRPIMDAVAVDLTLRGFVTWNVEYRRVGGGGGVPETLEDIEAALDYVGGTNLVAIGHSAGGHLALWAAGTGRVGAAVSLAGVCDLTHAVGTGLGDGAAVAFVGNHAELLPHADPALRLPTGVPQLLVHGLDDDSVPVEYTRRYADVARRAGDPVELLELPGAGHFDVVDPRSEAWAEIAVRLDVRPQKRRIP